MIDILVCKICDNFFELWICYLWGLVKSCTHSKFSFLLFIIVTAIDAIIPGELDEFLPSAISLLNYCIA